LRFAMFEAKRLTALFGRPVALAQVRRAAFVDGMRSVVPALIATGAWGWSPAWRPCASVWTSDRRSR